MMIRGAIAIPDLRLRGSGTVCVLLPIAFVHFSLLCCAAPSKDSAFAS